MPDGRVHTSVTVLSAVYSAAWLAGNVFDAGWPASSFALVAGCLAGVVLTPDLDLNGRNIGNSIIRHRFGSVAEFIWYLYWRPYSLLIPHRSWISHFPVLSTVVRFIYMFWWLLLIPNVLVYWQWIMWFFIGLSIADLNHVFLDFLRPDE